MRPPLTITLQRLAPSPGWVLLLPPGFPWYEPWLMVQMIDAGGATWSDDLDSVTISPERITVKIHETALPALRRIAAWQCN